MQLINTASGFVAMQKNIASSVLTRKIYDEVARMLHHPVHLDASCLDHLRLHKYVLQSAHTQLQLGCTSYSTQSHCSVVYEL